MSTRKYNEEFRRSAIALVTEQKYTPEKAAESLGVKISTLRYWLVQHRKNGGVSVVEEQDLRKLVAALEKDNTRLRMERDILKKATAFFAKEQP